MRTLVVDPQPSGHCAFYLSLIVQALAGEEIHLLTPKADPEVEAHFTRHGLILADCHSIQPRSTCAKDVVAQAAELVRERRIDRVFFCYLDTYLELLLTAAESFPCAVTGIWFHPYALDGHYRWLPPIDRRLRHRGTIHRALRKLGNPLQIERLFFLDPAAPAKLAAINSKIPAAVLPDPWERTPSLTQAAARARFDLPEDRVIFLHIGASERRKGLSDTLAAFQKLASSPVLGIRPLLLRVGTNTKLKPTDQALLTALVSQGLAHLVDDYVPECDFIEYFAAADWILLPYRNFRFSSGILSNAIGAGKPVIAADHGLIGKTVREQNLGFLFRHASCTDFARALSAALETAPSHTTPGIAEALAPERFIRLLGEACLTT